MFEVRRRSRTGPSKNRSRGEGASRGTILVTHTYPIGTLPFLIGDDYVFLFFVVFAKEEYRVREGMLLY